MSDALERLDFTSGAAVEIIAASSLAPKMPSSIPTLAGRWPLVTVHQPN